MKKLIINNRDELVILTLDHIAAIVAEGNCVKLLYLTGMKQRTLTIGITKFYDMIRGAYNNSPACPFVKLGRSVIINQIFLYDINILRQVIILSDDTQNLQVTVPKQLLRQYRDMILKTQQR
mgnify:CR=1 FL=1